MNLGFLAESQRLADSADTVIVVEPNVGSTSRTKGSLFLLVTGSGGRKLRDATKLVAERIRDDYYYDQSAGISVCLRKSVRAANRQLFHSPDRPVVGPGEPRPIGLALAVVRGNELYVATAGPAEAYLVRQARLLTLPDASPDSGMPSEDIDGPEVWHGEITAGDCLILMSPNVTRRVGLGPIQDAVLQLHPQAAVEQIHRQFGSGSLGSTGGDGLLFVEATEVASTHKAAPLKPVWPGDSMSGAPDRSPIPLADTVVGGVAVMQTTARQAQVAADGWLRRGVYGLFDRMPQRPMSRGRVTPMTVRRERQQRAAFAIIGLLVVISIVGLGAYFASGSNHSDNVDRQEKGQQAFADAQANIALVFGNGRDLMSTDPVTADGYLEKAYKQLQIAQDNGYTAAMLAGPRAQVIAGLNRYYHVTIVQPQVVLSFGTDNLADTVLGPDGAAYILDTTAGKVYRVDLTTGAKLAVAAAGQQAPAPGGIMGVVTNPRLITTGGGDVLILDSSNSLWTWHPAASSSTGRGVLKKVFIPDNETWGLGAKAIGTFVVNPVLGQYNFYIVLPSDNQIIKYPPAPDGSGYPAAGAAKYLSVAQDVSNITDMYVDGKVYLVDKGKITQYQLGQAVHGWTVDAPTGTLIRPTPPYYTRLVANTNVQDQGVFYGFDNQNRRIVAFKKIDGTIVGQYMVPDNTPWLTDVTGMFVTGGVDATNPILYWTESGNLMGAALNPANGGTPSPSGSVKPSTSGGSLPPASPSTK
jgi:type II secretory pathway pseudopilin PulG